MQAAGEWVGAGVPVSRGCRQEAEGRGGCGAMGNGARRMLGWAVGDSLVRGARGRPARASGVPVMGRVLVELVLGEGLGSLEIEDRGLVEVELGLGRAACGGHPGRPMWQVEMEEDVLHGGGEGDERDDLHLATACGAQKREHLADASQELSPEHAARS